MCTLKHTLIYVHSQILRRIANEKMRLTNSKIRNKPATQALKDKILHGHNLRELSKQPVQGSPQVRCMCFLACLCVHVIV